MPLQKPVPQRKLLAMGDTLKGWAQGGRIGRVPDAVPAQRAPVTPKLSPLTKARRDNGIPGMSCGGKVHKK